MALHDIGEKPGKGRYCCAQIAGGLPSWMTTAIAFHRAGGGKGQKTKYRDC